MIRLAALSALALTLPFPALGGDAPEDQARAKAVLGALFDEAQIEARLEDPAYLAAGWSSVRCYWLAEKADAVKELATEKRYARLGGVIDARKNYGLQLWARKADEHAAEAAQQLRAMNVAPLDCRQPHMKTISACVVAWAAWEDAEEDCHGVLENHLPQFLQALDPSIVRR